MSGHTTMTMMLVKNVTVPGRLPPLQNRIKQYMSDKWTVSLRTTNILTLRTRPNKENAMTFTS